MAQSDRVSQFAQYRKHGSIDLELAETKTETGTGAGTDKRKILR